MAALLNRVFGSQPLVQTSNALGRVFNVTRETWRLSDDPKLTSPKVELLVTSRTASDAADFARRAAFDYKRHGFHKPSGAWWGADAEQIHRIVVHAGRRRFVARRLGFALVGVAVLSVIGFSQHRRASRPAA